MSFVYLHNITIRKSAVISVTDVVYQPAEENSDEQWGIFTVTLTNGYPITFRGLYGVIEKECEEFMKEVEREDE